MPVSKAHLRGCPPSCRRPAQPVHHPTTNISAPGRMLSGNQVAPWTVGFLPNSDNSCLVLPPTFFQTMDKVLYFLWRHGYVIFQLSSPLFKCILTMARPEVGGNLGFGKRVVTRCSHQCKQAPFYSTPLTTSSFRVLQLDEVMSETKRGRMTVFQDIFFLNKTLK